MERFGLLKVCNCTAWTWAGAGFLSKAWLHRREKCTELYRRHPPYGSPIYYAFCKKAWSEKRRQKSIVLNSVQMSIKTHFTALKRKKNKNTPPTHTHNRYTKLYNIQVKSARAFSEELSSPYSVTAFIYLLTKLPTSMYGPSSSTVHCFIIVFFGEKILSKPVSPLHSLFVMRHHSCME